MLADSRAEMRSLASETLRTIQKERFLPTSRIILERGSFGDRIQALFALGAYGIKDDLPLVMRYADFSTADRKLQYWGKQAEISLRKRWAIPVAPLNK